MKDAWINTKGQVIEVPDSHDRYADELLREEMGFEGMMEYMDENGFNYPYEVLHARGWVRMKTLLDRMEIMGNCIDLTNPMKNTIDPAMNQLQMKAAKRLCMEYGANFHEVINDKRFW